MAAPHTFVTGENVTAATLNQEVRDKILLCTAATHPSSPYGGQIIFETDTLLLKIYDGTAWQTVLLGNQKTQMVAQSGTGVAGSGWGNDPAFAPAEYRRTVDGLCELSGVLRRTDPSFTTTAGTFYTIGFVPSSMAPTDGTKQFDTWTTSGAGGVIRVSTAGTVSFASLGTAFTCTQNAWSIGIEASWWI